MKKLNLVKMTLSLAFVVSLTQLSSAQKAVFSADFSKDTLKGYNFSGGGSDSAASVSDGSLVLAVDLSPANANTGVHWDDQATPSGNTDTSLSNYTVSFDLAVPSGALTGVRTQLTIAGSSSDNVRVPIDLSMVTPGGAFAHYSIPLGDLEANSGFKGGNSKLNPADTSYSFEFAVFGNNSGSVTFKIKNLQITHTGTDDSSSKPK